jgi:hypothetical protein
MAYTLTRRETSPGRYSVDRHNWSEFPLPGDWCLTDRRVLRSNLSATTSRRFAEEYVATHSGFTAKPAASQNTETEEGR